MAHSTIFTSGIFLFFALCVDYFDLECYRSLRQNIDLKLSEVFEKLCLSYQDRLYIEDTSIKSPVINQVK